MAPVHQTAPGNVVEGLCEAVRRMPGEIRNSGVVTLQFVWNAEHTTHNTLHTTHCTLHTFFLTRTLAWASMLVYVLKYRRIIIIEVQTNMPTREEETVMADM